MRATFVSERAAWAFVNKRLILDVQGVHHAAVKRAIDAYYVLWDGVPVTEQEVIEEENV